MEHLLNIIQAFYTHFMDQAVSSSDAYVEAMTPKVTVFGDGNFKEVIKV